MERTLGVGPDVATVVDDEGPPAVAGGWEVPVEDWVVAG